MSDAQLPATTNTTENLPVEFVDNSYDGMSKSDIVFPRLAIGQPTSPKVIDGVVKMGDLHDTMSNSCICGKEETVLLLPIMFWKDWIEWNPDRDAPKDVRILNRSVDPNSELAKIAERREKVKDKKGKEVYRITESYNMLVAFPEKFGYDQLFLWSLNRSAHTPAKMMINAARMMKCKHPSNGQLITAPFWSVIWTVGIKKEVKESNTYFVPTFKSAKAIDDKDLFVFQYSKYQTLVAMKDAIQRVNQDAGEEHVTEASTGEL